LVKNNLFDTNNYDPKNPPRNNKEFAKRVFSQNSPTNKNNILGTISKSTIKTTTK